VPQLLHRLSTPTSPAALLQALHPDLGTRLPGARASGTVQRMSPEPSGLVIDINGPVAWTGPGVAETVVIALDVAGVRHSGTFEQLEPRTPEALATRSWRRSTKIRILVDRGADDPVSRHLRGSTAIGDRVYLGRPPSIDLRPADADSPAVGSDAVSNLASPGGRDAAGVDGFTVRFAQSGVSVPAGAEGVLLDLAESAGLEPTTGCRRGVCHRCTTEVLSGSTINTRDGTVGHPGDAVRICVSTATTDVELNL
jgi:ferredoxin